MCKSTKQHYCEGPVCALSPDKSQGLQSVCPGMHGVCAVRVCVCVCVLSWRTPHSSLCVGIVCGDSAHASMHVDGMPSVKVVGFWPSVKVVGFWPSVKEVGFWVPLVQGSRLAPLQSMHRD